MPPSRRTSATPSSGPSAGRDRLTGDLARAAASWLVFVVALGLAGVTAEAARSAGLGGDVARAVPALVVVLVTVPLVLVAHGRSRWVPVLALHRPARGLVGLAVVLGSAAAVFGVDRALGGIDVIGVDVRTLVPWLLTTLALALALEAVPEELAFRGGVFGGLRRHVPGWVAGLATTAAFVVAPWASNGVTAQVGELVGVGVPPVTFAPGGQDPVAYGVLLAAFSVVLLLVRAVTGSVFACIGAHLSFLVVNRLLLGDAAATGVEVRTDPGSQLLVLWYLAVAAVVLGLALRRR